MIFVNPDCFHGYRFPSIGMMYIAAKLKAEGLPAHYIDCNYEEDWRERLARLVDKDPLVGITANVLSIRPAMEVAEYIRGAHPAAKIIMGGPYPTVEYARIIPKSADAVVLGEGEEAAVDIQRGAPFEDIASLAYAKNGGVVANERRPLIADLDAMPFPAWELGTVSRYRLQHTKCNPVMPVVTSRGCPYNCVFCGSDIINGNRIRYRGVDNVLDEIDRIRSVFGVREIQFWDDNFTLKRERAMQICEGIISRGHNDLCLSIPSGIKPDMGDDELFRTMVRAGFYFICIAVETGSQEVMTQLGKKVDLSKVADVIRSATKAGLLVNGFFMLGLPFDTEATMKRTIAFARRLPLHQALFFVTIPFPGTNLHDIVTERGKFLFHTTDDLYRDGYFMGRASYEMPGQFDKELLEKMYRRANRAFFLHPLRMLRLARRRIRRPYDVFYILMKGIRVVLRGRQF